MTAYDPGNIFGKIIRGEIPAHKVYEDADVLVMMDIFPQSKGHTLIIPKAPSRNLLDADPAALSSTSIKELITRSGRSLSALVRGPNSLGSLLEARSFLCVPSPSKAAPTPGADYFSGAYDVQAHGSRDAGSVSAIQVECPWKGVRDTEANRKVFVEALADSLVQYFPAVFKMPLAKKQR